MRLKNRSRECETMIRVVVMTIVLAGMSACSNSNSKGTYDAIQQGQQRQCDPLPPGEYERCMDAYEKPYEEYEQDRKLLQ